MEWSGIEKFVAEYGEKWSVVLCKAQYSAVQYRT